MLWYLRLSLELDPDSLQSSEPTSLVIISDSIRSFVSNVVVPFLLLLFVVWNKSNQVPGAPNGQVILVGVLDKTGEIVERHDIHCE
jgi:hypothetical protein